MTRAFVLVEAWPGHAREALREILDCIGSGPVKSADLVHGPYDVIVELETPEDSRVLSNFVADKIGCMRSVVRTTTCTIC